MTQKEIQSITIKNLEIRMKDAATRGLSHIIVDPPLSDKTKKQLEISGYEIVDLVRMSGRARWPIHKITW